jgi:TatD DNase family protein
MAKMLVDTHCHLDFHSFDGDLENVILRAQTSGVARIIVPALDLDNWGNILRIASNFEGVFAAVGIHPNSSAGWQDAWIDEIRAAADHDCVVAVGEIGLDYYRSYSPREQQLRALSSQLELAEQLGLPVILHNRESDSDLLAVLGDSGISNRENPGVLHSFSASWDTAVKAMDLGYYLGFTGPVTYKKADELREIVRKVPVARLLVETDAPFLAPQQHRGRRNEPAYVKLIAERIAEERAVSFDEIAGQTTQNAITLFGEALR